MPTLIKTFTYTRKGDSYWLGSEPMDRHIQKLVNSGWEPLNTVTDSGHMRVGKTVTLAALTGGLNLLFGESRTKPTLTVTFKRTAEGPAVDAADEPPTANDKLVGLVVILVLLCLLAGLKGC